MAGNHSRRKGSGAELELARLVLDHLGVRLIRRLDQPRAGGHDLEVHPDETGPVAAQIARYALEVKRASTASPAMVASWWRQAAAQATAASRVPCLAYRVDRQGWAFMVPLKELNRAMPNHLTDSADYCATLSLQGWAALIRGAHNSVTAQPGRGGGSPGDGLPWRRALIRTGDNNAVSEGVIRQPTGETAGHHDPGPTARGHRGGGSRYPRHPGERREGRRHHGRQAPAGSHATGS